MKATQNIKVRFQVLSFGLEENGVQTKKNILNF
jgi:hypothetical protein